MKISSDTSKPINHPCRVGLVVIDDGLYTHRWVIPTLEAADIDVVCVATISPLKAIEFNPGGVRGLRRATLMRMRYYGPVATWKYSCMWASNRTIDLLFRMKLCRKANSVVSAARSLGIESFTPPNGDINHPEFCDRLAARRPDLVVCSFSQRAEKPFLQTPRLGCLNVHFSLLPEHRGREPSFRAMLSGKGAGVSIHWMVPEIDVGGVVLQSPLDLCECKTLHDAILQGCNLAGRLLPEAIRKAARHPIASSRQESGLPINSWPTAQEVTLFRRKGFHFV